VLRVDGRMVRLRHGRTLTPLKNQPAGSEPRPPQQIRGVLFLCAKVEDGPASLANEFFAVRIIDHHVASAVRALGGYVNVCRVIIGGQPYRPRPESSEPAGDGFLLTASLSFFLHFLKISSVSHVRRR